MHPDLPLPELLRPAIEFEVRRINWAYFQKCHITKPVFKQSLYFKSQTLLLSVLLSAFGN